MNIAIVAFAQKLAAFRSQNQELIKDLCINLCIDAASIGEEMDDEWNELKCALGADAANEVGDQNADQEAAITEAENWVTNEISNGTNTDQRS